MSHSEETKVVVGRIKKLHLEARELIEKYDKKYGAPNGKRYSCKEG